MRRRQRPAAASAYSSSSIDPFPHGNERNAAASSVGNALQIDTELPRTLLKTVQGVVVAVVADPDLGLQKHLGTVHTRGVNGLTHLPFVAVRGGSVDVPIAGVLQTSRRPPRFGSR